MIPPGAQSSQRGGPQLYLSLDGLKAGHDLKHPKDSVHRRPQLVYPLDSRRWRIFKRDWHKYTHLHCKWLGVGRRIPPLVPVCIYSYLSLRKHFALLGEDWIGSAYEYRYKKLDSTRKSTEGALLFYWYLYNNFWFNLHADKADSVCSEQCETWASGNTFLALLS